MYLSPHCAIHHLVVQLCSWTTGPRPPRSVHRVPSSVRSVSSPLEFGAISPLGWLLQIINIFIKPSALPFELPSFLVRTSHETVVSLQNYHHKSFSPRCPGAHEECGIRGATFGTSGGALPRGTRGASMPKNVFFLWLTWQFLCFFQACDFSIFFSKTSSSSKKPVHWKQVTHFVEEEAEGRRGKRNWE